MKIPLKPFSKKEANQFHRVNECGILEPIQIKKNIEEKQS